MTKILFSIFTVFFLSSESFGQSKKEQIEKLNYRLDSLHIVVKSKSIETFMKDSIIKNLTTQIKTINTTLESKELEILRLNDSLLIKDSEILRKTNEIEGLNELINKLKDTIITSRQISEKLIFDIPPPSGVGTGVCSTTLTVDNFILLANETCGGHDDNGHFESTQELFHIAFKRDFKYKVSELINIDFGSSFGCEYFEIIENKLYLYDENKKVLNEWFCTLYGNAVNYEENMETCDCIFLPSKN